MSKHRPEIPPKLTVFPTPKPVTTREEWGKLILSDVNRYKKILRKTPEKGNAVNIFDLSDSMVKRRVRAMLNTIPEIYTRYQAPDRNQPVLGEVWRDMNLPFITYSQLNSFSHILYAASIWILDQITRQENWKDIYRYLPTDESFLDDLIKHDAWHAEYDYDLIYSVEYVLHHRNPPEEDDAQNPRVLTSETLALGCTSSSSEKGTTDYKAKKDKYSGRTGRRIELTDEDVSNRKNYEALIQMIPKEAIETAVKNFKKYFWQWVDRFYESAVPFFEEEMKKSQLARDTQERYNQVVDQLSDLMDQLRVMQKQNRRREKVSPTIPHAMRKTSVLERQPQLCNDLLPYPELPPTRPGLLSEAFRSPDTDLDTVINKAIKLARMLEEIQTQSNDMISAAEDVHMQLRTYCMDMARMGRISGDFPRNYGEIYVAPMSPMDITDPYEMCFALMYLIEADDDLPWLYGAGCGLMGEVAESLPWGIVEYDELKDDAWENTFSTLPKSIALPNWNERKYQLKHDFDFPRSLAQILYEETGCLLPRDSDIYKCRAKLLGKYGVRGKDAAWLIVLMSTLGIARRGREAFNLKGDSRYLQDDDAEKELSEDSPSSATEQEETSVDDLKSEIKRLKTALHMADKENREVRKSLETLKSVSEREHRELSDLREYVFHQEQNTEPVEEETAVGDQWPYTVQKDTVVFGGHATWVKGIKSILNGNIRFIDKDLLFDIGIVRHANIIWIQPNAISHRMYWRIMDTARAHGKAVRYFSYASWAKCAQQVVEGDK